MNQHDGMTLIELMCSLLLSMLIIMCLIDIYIATEKNHLAQSALMNVQQNARMAMQILTHEIRRAGYVGCSKIMMMKYKIEKYSSPDVKPGSDAITIYNVTTDSGTVTSMSDLKTLEVMDGPSFHVGENLFVSDCVSAEVFSIKKVIKSGNNSQRIMTMKNLSKKYSQFAEVGRVENNSYYIGQTTRVDEDGKPIFVLYKLDSNDRKLELVEGINDMQIDFTILSDGSLSQSKTANGPELLGVAVELTLSGLNHFPLFKKEYNYVALRQI